jgi:hypothetical protein
VFEYGINDDDSLGVNIYSSKIRAWIFKESEWGEGIVVSIYGKGVFHNYRLTYHCHHFHCCSDRSDRVILPPTVGTIVRPPGNKTSSLDFYHRWVNVRCGSGVGVAFAPSHEKPGRLGYAFCLPALN